MVAPQTKLDRDDRAGDAGGPRGISHGLAGVAGADRPHAASSLLVGEARDRVGGTADLVGIGRLQVFELQADIGTIGAKVQADERRP
jgi:hypothetical protein